MINLALVIEKPFFFIFLLIRIISQANRRRKKFSNVSVNFSFLKNCLFLFLIF